MTPGDITLPVNVLSIILKFMGNISKRIFFPSRRMFFFRVSVEILCLSNSGVTWDVNGGKKRYFLGRSLATRRMLHTSLDAV